MEKFAEIHAVSFLVRIFYHQLYDVFGVTKLSSNWSSGIRHITKHANGKKYANTF